MVEKKNFFADGEAYDRTMGRMSRVAGDKFLEWLSLPNGLHWLDVGCGTGSFTELILDRNAPSAITAIDPSEEQIAYTRKKSTAGRVDYRCGDAMSLPFGANEFDVAVMALVVQYIPDPAKAMAEITRVVRPEGTVAAYVWPGHGEGHPYQPLGVAVRSIGGSGTGRPGTQMRTTEALVDLFAASGLENVETKFIELSLMFDDFDDYWSAQHTDLYKTLSSSDIARLTALLRESLPTDGKGCISYTARVNAIRGQVTG
jgi:SAM-dependent methyltransferase